MNTLGPILWSIGPTIGVGAIFWFVMRAILRADRNEREAQARIEAELDAADLAAARRDLSA